MLPSQQTSCSPVLNGSMLILWGILSVGLCLASLTALGSTSTRGSTAEGDQALSLGRSHLASRTLSATKLGGELCWAQASGRDRGAREERPAGGCGGGGGGGGAGGGGAWFLQEAAGSGSREEVTAKQMLGIWRPVALGWAWTNFLCVHPGRPLRSHHVSPGPRRHGAQAGCVCLLGAAT